MKAVNSDEMLEALRQLSPDKIAEKIAAQEIVEFRGGFYMTTKGHMKMLERLKEIGELAERKVPEH